MPQLFVRPLRFALALVCAAFTAACGTTRVEGTVDGAAPPPFSSSCFTQSSTFSLFAARFVAYSFADGCARRTALRAREIELVDALRASRRARATSIDAASAATTSDELEDLDAARVDARRALLPEEFWSITVDITRADDDDIRDDYDVGLDRDFVAVRLCRFRGFSVPSPDPDTGVDRNQDCYDGAEGSLVVDAFEKSARLSLYSGPSLALIDRYEDLAGAVSLTGVAPHDQAYEAATRALEKAEAATY